MKIKITSDVFDITKRLKKIDESYYVLFDTKKKMYELHSNCQKESFCLSLPFECLDNRTIEKTLKTKVENRKALFAELENQFF